MKRRAPIFQQALPPVGQRPNGAYPQTLYSAGMANVLPSFNVNAAPKPVIGPPQPKQLNDELLRSNFSTTPANTAVAGVSVNANPGKVNAAYLPGKGPQNASGGSGGISGIFDYILNSDAFGGDKNALSQALIGMGQGLLQAGGPSTMPTSMGQAIGAGAQGLVQGIQQGKQITAQDKAYIARQRWDAIKNDFDPQNPKHLAALYDVDPEAATKIQTKLIEGRAKETWEIVPEGHPGYNPDVPMQISSRGKLQPQAGSGGTQVQVSLDNKGDSAMLDIDAATVSDIQENVAAGRDMSPYIDRIITGIEGGVKTGALIDATFGLRQMLNDMGWRDDPGLSAEENVRSAMAYMIPRMRPIGSGSTSDVEIKLFTQAAPNMANTPTGNLLIGRSMKQVQARKEAELEIIRREFRRSKNLDGIGGIIDSELGPLFPKPQTPEDHAALPAGTVYIHPTNGFSIKK